MTALEAKLGQWFGFRVEGRGSETFKGNHHTRREMGSLSLDFIERLHEIVMELLLREGIR